MKLNGFWIVTLVSIILAGGIWLAFSTRTASLITDYGQATNKAFELNKSFRKINIDIPVTITIILEPNRVNDRFEVQAGSQVIDDIKFETTTKTITFIQDTPRIVLDLGWLSEDNDNNIRIIYYTKDLDELEVGGKTIVNMSNLEGETFELISDTSNQVNLRNLKVENFKLSQSNAGLVNVIGSANNLEIENSGSGRSNFQFFDAKDVRIKTSGTGDAIIKSSQSLNVEIKGSGGVTYIGNPSSIEKNITGTGNLQKV